MNRAFLLKQLHYTERHIAASAEHIDKSSNDLALITKPIDFAALRSEIDVRIERAA